MPRPDWKPAWPGMTATAAPSGRWSSWARQTASRSVLLDQRRLDGAAAEVPARDAAELQVAAVTELGQRRPCLRCLSGLPRQAQSSEPHRKIVQAIFVELRGRRRLGDDDRDAEASTLRSGSRYGDTAWGIRAGGKQSFSCLREDSGRSRRIGATGRQCQWRHAHACCCETLVALDRAPCPPESPDGTWELRDEHRQAARGVQRAAVTRGQVRRRSGGGRPPGRWAAPAASWSLPLLGIVDDGNPSVGAAGRVPVLQGEARARR